MKSTAWPRRIAAAGMALIASLGVWVFPLPAQASVITDCPAGTCSLQELVDGSTITINDKQFGGWQLFTVDSSLSTPPDPRLIRVDPIDDPQNPGLRYSANGQLSINQGIAEDVILFDYGYVVRTLTGFPSIEDNTLELMGPRFSGDGGLVEITESVCLGAFLCDPSSSSLLAVKDVLLDNLGGVSRPIDSAQFPPQAELFVVVSVLVSNDFAGESVALDDLEQRWSQVQIPEPGSIASLGIGLGVLGVVRLLRPSERRRHDRTG